MQRMSSVDDDHASVVSNDDSSRDRDEEVDSEDSSDPSEKPEEESSVQSPIVVDSPIAGSDSVITTGGNVAEVDSPMVVEDDEEEEDEEEESSASEEDSAQQNNQVSDNINNSSAVVSSGVMILPSGDSVSDATAADTILEEIARLSAELNRRVASVDASVVAQSTPAGVSDVVSSGNGGGAMRSVGNPLVNSDMVPRVRRWLPYQVPRNSSNSASASQQGSTSSSSSANTPSSAQSQSRRTSLPQQQQHQGRISGNSQPRRSVANTNIPGAPRTTSSSTSALPTAAPGQRQQGNINNVPQQVIRSAIVGNRTIITTKTPSKFPFSADLKQAGAAILGDRYILLDLCDGTSLYKCIDVKTKEEFVCKVSEGR